MTLRAIRLSKEVSKERMAEALGIHVNTYSRLEDDPGRITINQAKIISDMLDVSFDIFLQTDSTKCRVDPAETAVSS